MAVFNNPPGAPAEVAGLVQLRMADAKSFDAKALLDRLDGLHERMPMTQPVVEAMRRDVRY